MTEKSYIIEVDWITARSSRGSDTEAQCWINFIESMPLVKSQEEWLKHIDRELEKYNAQRLEVEISTLNDRVLFDSEEDYIVFKLRWS